jgi:hypothetical protein
MFYCVKWAKMGRLLIDEQGNGTLNQLHVCILVIQFGLNHLPCEQIEAHPCWLEQVFIIKNKFLFIKYFYLIQQNKQPQSRLDLEKQHGGLGKKFIRFLEFLSSRQFQLLPFVDFNEPEMGFQSVLMQNQLGIVHKVKLHLKRFFWPIGKCASFPKKIGSWFDSLIGKGHFIKLN